MNVLETSIIATNCASIQLVPMNACAEMVTFYTKMEKHA